MCQSGQVEEKRATEPNLRRIGLAQVLLSSAVVDTAARANSRRFEAVGKVKVLLDMVLTLHMY